MERSSNCIFVDYAHAESVYSNEIAGLLGIPIQAYLR